MCLFPLFRYRFLLVLFFFVFFFSFLSVIIRLFSVVCVFFLFCFCVVLSPGSVFVCASSGFTTLDVLQGFVLGVLLKCFLFKRSVSFCSHCFVTGFYCFCFSCPFSVLVLCLFPPLAFLCSTVVVYVMYSALFLLLIMCAVFPWYCLQSVVFC